MGPARVDAGSESSIEDTFVSAPDDTATEPEVETDSGPCGLTINELQTGDGSSGNADFVEIHNSCVASASLASHKLVYRSSAGTTDVIVWTFPSGATIEGKGYMVLGGSGYAGSKAGILASGLAVGGGAIGLRDGSDALIDAVGYGSATNALVEGAPANAPGDSTPAKSLARKPNGRDTDNNASDLTVADPTPGAPN